MSKEGHFFVKKISTLSELSSEKNIKLPESDLTVQTDTHLIQFQYKKAEEQKLIEIKPGCYSLSSTSMGTIPQKMELRKYNLLKTVTNTSVILNEADKFFSRLHIYDEIKRDKKRALLLSSVPGVGKTAAINEVCSIFLKEDKGTCVIIWDTSAVRSQDVNSFFLKNSKFNDKVTRLIFVMEDVEGGSEDEISYRSRGTESSLLNLLDGVGNPFKGVPTFIIATTNNPEKSVAALIDRPGRFDKMVELSPPNQEETVQLLAFIANRDLTEEEIKSAKKASKNKFSIAHLQEVVVRSLIDNISISEAVDQLVIHKEKFANAFQDTKKMGLL